MSVSQKILSAFHLLVRGNFQGLYRQALVNERGWTLRRHGRRPFVHRRRGFPEVCHPDWTDSAEIFRINAGDHWEFRLLARWLEPGDQVLDLGANLGCYSFAALSAVGPSGLVVAVDAAPYVTEKLQASARLLGSSRLHVVQTAVTDRMGEIEFHVMPAGAITMEQSIHPAEHLLGRTVKVTVPATTLTDLQRREALDQRLSLIKVDIEGAEVAALRAAPAAWFGADGPLWIVEINPDALTRFGTTPQAILGYFPAERFDCWLLSKHPRNPTDAPSLRPAFAEETFGDSHYYNLFALPRGAGRRARARRLAAFFPGSPLTRAN